MRRKSHPIAVNRRVQTAAALNVDEIRQNVESTKAIAARAISDSNLREGEIDGEIRILRQAEFTQIGAPAMSAFAIHSMPGPLGAAEILGLDIERDARDEAKRALLREALAKHGVMCVRQSAALEDA